MLVEGSSPTRTKWATRSDGASLTAKVREEKAKRARIKPTRRGPRQRGAPRPRNKRMRSLSAWKRSEITIDATHPGLAKSLDKELRAVDYFQGKAARPPNPWRIIVGYGKLSTVLQHGSEEVSRKIEVLCTGPAIFPVAGPSPNRLFFNELGSL